jgi:Fe-S-cluster containining protein
MNVERFNRRVPVVLEREQEALPKKVRKPKVAPLEGLRQVFEVLDKYGALAAGLIACKKGCSYCCHAEVAISGLEAALIAEATGRVVNKVVERKPVEGDAWLDANRPCPFLGKDHECAIYAVRPMVCRTHVNFEATNKACRFDADPSAHIPMLDRSKSYPGAMRAWGELNVRTDAVVADIREFFN